ncbi:MAG: hypothetical protein HKM90_02875 [Desulfobacteraceae bacterium]|nr:hypothetical protein [Desulfobacteraceae bacterium]
MAKKKKPKKKKPDPSSLLSQEQQTQLSSLLKNFKNLNSANVNEQIPGPELAQAFIERLPTQDSEAVPALLAVREAFPEKKVQKAIKKTIFKFKQKGISHPDLEPEKGPAVSVKRLDVADPSAYIGPVDGTGSRGILLILPQIPKGVEVGMGAVSDELGFIQFFVGRYSKKQLKEIREIFFSSFDHAVETPISHAVTILERAYSKNKEGLNESSRGYLQLRPWILENISLLEQSAVYDLIPPDSLSKGSLTRSQIERLLDHELMKTWIIDPDRLKPLTEDIQKVKESRILVSDAQKTDQINEARGKAISEIYSEDKRLLMKWRLEEMAYFFFKLEEEEMARLSLMAALSLDEKDSPLLINPFLDAIMERSLAFHMQAAQDTQESKGLIEDSPSSIIIP